MTQGLIVEQVEETVEQWASHAAKVEEQSTLWRMMREGDRMLENGQLDPRHFLRDGTRIPLRGPPENAAKGTPITESSTVSPPEANVSIMTDAQQDIESSERAYDDIESPAEEGKEPIFTHPEQEASETLRVPVVEPDVFKSDPQEMVGRDPSTIHLGP